MSAQVCTTRGMSGWYAVVHDDCEPLYTGDGRYATQDEAIAEAVGMSVSENYPLSESAMKRAVELGLTATIHELQPKDPK